MKNYNEYKEVELLNINNKILTKINTEKVLTIFLLDFLNINSETINTYHKIIAPKILIISKKDIIPNSIKEDNITAFLRDNYNIEEDIFYLSSRKKYNIKKIVELISNTKDKTAYIVGYTNSGKSTFINSITSSLKNESLITTSSIPNTTLDFMNINIDDLHIIDTPGFVLEKNIYMGKDYAMIKKINPKSYIKPITIQTKINTGILVENLFYFQPHSNNSLTFYISNNLNIAKVYEEKLLDQEKNIISIPNNSDIVIKGVGFINIKRECQLEINSSYIDLLELRKSLFTKE